MAGISDITNITTQSVVYALIGMALGVLTNNVVTRVQVTSTTVPTWTNTIAKTIVIALVLAIVQIVVSSSFAADWQSTTPGLFFGSLFFGVQSNLLNSIPSLP